MKKGGVQTRNMAAIKTLAFNVRKFRKERNMTIVELANQLNVDYSQIGRIERGVVNTNVSIIFDIAKVLNVTPSQLLDF